MAEFSKAQQEYLRFGKALLSGDSNFPEIPPAVSSDVFDTFIEESIAAKVFRFITMGSDIVKFYVKAGALAVYSPPRSLAAAGDKAGLRSTSRA
jgi:hypothetical protein